MTGLPIAIASSTTAPPAFEQAGQHQDSRPPQPIARTRSAAASPRSGSMRPAPRHRLARRHRNDRAACVNATRAVAFSAIPDDHEPNRLACAGLREGPDQQIDGLPVDEAAHERECRHRTPARPPCAASSRPFQTLKSTPFSTISRPVHRRPAEEPRGCAGLRPAAARHDVSRIDPIQRPGHSLGATVTARGPIDRRRAERPAATPCPRSSGR
jgi:hypothetical protein